MGKIYFKEYIVEHSNVSFYVFYCLVNIIKTAQQRLLGLLKKISNSLLFVFPVNRRSPFIL